MLGACAQAPCRPSFGMSQEAQSQAGTPNHDLDSQGALESTAGSFAVGLRGGQSKFRQGETITVELRYSTGGSSAAPPAADDKRKWLIVDGDGLRLDPQVGVVDPLADYFAGIGILSGPLPRWVPAVEEGAKPVPIDLNEWFRFDKPGTYRLFLTAHVTNNRFSLEGSEDAPLPSITSNPVEFQVLPADPTWAAQELRRTIGLLDAKGGTRDPLESCRALRFLGSQAAASEMIKRYSDDPICEFQYRVGLFNFPDREFAVRQMKARLSAPDQAVSEDYLETLARLSVYLLHPPTAPDHSPGESLSLGGLPRETYSLVQAQQSQYVWLLVDALDRKVGQARAVSLKTLFDDPFAGNATSLRAAPTALVNKLKQEFAAAFLGLTEADQDMMLRNRWEKFAGPAMLPVLRHIYENPSTHVFPPTSGIALRRLYELDPVQGRELILAQIESAHPRVGIETLGLLPEKELPGRVGNMPCAPQAALLAYCLRAEPETGRDMLERAVASRATGCSGTVLTDTARLYMSPELETVALVVLSDPNPEIAASSATMLGRYGSPAAEQPLWQRFEQWHSVWEGREAELPDRSWGEGIANSSETTLEMALLNALATGQAWWVGPQELRRLRALCVSRWSGRNADATVQQGSVGPLIAVNSFGSGTYMASLSQYQLDSIEALKEKVSQFPKGTGFTLELNGSDPQEMTHVTADLKAFIDERGMRIVGCRFWQGVPTESELPDTDPESPCHSLPPVGDDNPAGDLTAAYSQD
jgi:hypothetical protein